MGEFDVSGFRSLLQNQNAHFTCIPTFANLVSVGNIIVKNTSGTNSGIYLLPTDYCPEVIMGWRIFLQVGQFGKLEGVRVDTEL